MSAFTRTFQFTIPLSNSAESAQCLQALESYDFCSPPPDSLLVGTPSDLSSQEVHQYLVGDAFSSFSPPTPGATPEAPSPQRVSKAFPPSSRRRNATQPPRPRNAFMIYRSEIWAKEKIPKDVEHDHRHISRIIGHCWNQMPEDEKNVWRRKAAQEKLEHERRYPGYRFMPGTRVKKPLKRKVKRNSKEELDRCKQVATLLLSGKTGGELGRAVKNICPMQAEVPVAGGLPQQGFYSFRCELSTEDSNDLSPFRSPLLLPSDYLESSSVLTWPSPESRSLDTPIELAPGSFIYENPGASVGGCSASLTPPSPPPPPYMICPPAPLEDQVPSTQLHAFPALTEEPAVSVPNAPDMMHLPVASEPISYTTMPCDAAAFPMGAYADYFAYNYPTFQTFTGVQNPFCAPPFNVPSSVAPFFTSAGTIVEEPVDQLQLSPLVLAPVIGGFCGVGTLPRQYHGYSQPEIPFPRDFLDLAGSAEQSVITSVQWDVLGFPRQPQVIYQ